MSARLQQFGRAIITGQRRGPLAAAVRASLSLVEPLYAAAMILRNRKYDAGIGVKRLPRPTISVGNITTGGTGKTPVVAWLARELQKRGKNPAILLRGYRASETSGSDEAAMLAEMTGAEVRASPDRFAAAMQVPNAHVFILDDGFQHRRIARDFDLVLINATEPFGYDHVLPRGLLREPLAGLARADAILLTHCDEVLPARLAQIKREIKGTVPFISSSHRHAGVRDAQILPMDDLRRRKFFAFAGIGSPESFARSMRAYDTCVGQKFFPDHHNYAQKDIDELERHRDADVLVTTEKDWVKIRQLKISMPVLRIVLELAFEPGDDHKLMEQILAALSANPPA